MEIVRKCLPIFHSIILTLYRKLKSVFIMYIILPQWHNAGRWNFSSSKTRTYLFYITNIIGADVLATQGARASATTILTMFNQSNLVPARWGLFISSLTSWVSAAFQCNGLQATTRLKRTNNILYDYTCSSRQWIKYGVPLDQYLAHLYVCLISSNSRQIIRLNVQLGHGRNQDILCVIIYPCLNLK